MNNNNRRPLTKSTPLHTNDTIHKSIRLLPLLSELLNTPHLQRLRSLKQLGTSEYTYVNANHTRLEHSLGVAHLSVCLLRRIRNEQPELGISDRDLICVEIAGLCHDLGHGPFSHVFDGVFRSMLHKAVQKQGWLGNEWDVTMYKDIEELPEGWAHEDDSLRMFDDMLRYLGLGVNEHDLDGPLQEIGRSGIDARQFGFVDSTTQQFQILTSRDVIFIKECIAGGPLPPKHMSIKGLKRSNLKVEYIGRPHPHKEFLYDVIANRHSGFDFDKGDYLARDKFYCFGYKGFEQSVLERLFDNACVAWGECANPERCFRCRHERDGRGNAIAGRHLTICWPQKMTTTVRDFFEERFKNHLKIYTHPKTQACSYMICDILLLAEPYIRLSTENELEEDADNSNILQLPISRANTNPNSYWKLDDGILHLIHKSTDPNLKPARQLINRMKSRRLYQLCGEQDVEDEEWEKALWGMNEDDIVAEMLRLNESSVELQDYYIIIEKREIHHGMGAIDPVSCVRFVQSDPSELKNAPSELPTAMQMKVSSCLTPKNFLMKTVRVYCRVDDDSVCEQVRVCFKKLVESLQLQVQAKQTPTKTTSIPRSDRIGSFEIEEDDFVQEENGHAGFNVLTQSPILEEKQTPMLGKRGNQTSLFDDAVKRKR